MRKFILSAITLIITLSAGSSLATAQDTDQKIRAKAIIVADSVKSKGARLGKTVANGTALVVDSIGSKSVRFGQKAKVAGDTLSLRSKRALKVLKGEE